MPQTLFSLGLPPTPAPWAYHHSLGISVNSIKDWWNTEGPAIQQDIANAQGNGLNPGAVVPGAKKPTTPLPAGTVPRPMMPPAQTSDGTTILLSVLLVGGAVGGLYYYKQKTGKFPWDKNGKAGNGTAKSKAKAKTA